MCDSSTPEELGSEVGQVHGVVGNQNNRSALKRLQGNYNKCMLRSKRQNISSSQNMNWKEPIKKGQNFS